MKFIVVIVAFLSVYSFGQSPFIGKLVYNVEIADTSLTRLFNPSKMIIYTNDTLLRVETHTDALGTQVLIQHLQKNKAYLLIDSPNGKYAIQIPDVQQKQSNYHYKKGKGTKSIASIKSNVLLVTHPDVENQMEFYYNKKILAKYIPSFEDFPGLLTEYYTITQDGVYRHRLQGIDYKIPSKDLFGIPSDYQRVSMDDFVNLMSGGEKEEGK
ncbi:MAG: hypothetical protein M9916_05890 [Crocinitomicaceae bacterium]|nr:hypothetical protein [Crocinitomicaceae bacterium]